MTRQLANPSPEAQFLKKLHRSYALYTLGVLMFIVTLGLLEGMGLRKVYIGTVFLLVTVAVYAVIGIFCRTTDANEYYVAGRRVPAFYNGMAVAADWMSAASFIGLVGTLYLGGYAGLAFIMGWTGGFCLVGVLIVPYLRKLNHYTIPDFFADRYEGHAPRVISALAAIIVSFIYVVAQIYGVGLISTRLTGVAFEIGIFLGLGGVLLCSFLGGMRAVTWTQVAQYIVIIVAFLVPACWLSLKHTGHLLPQWGATVQLQKLSQREAALLIDPAELQVIDIYKLRIRELDVKLGNPVAAMAQDRLLANRKITELKARGALNHEVYAAEKALNLLPRDEATAKRQWTQARDHALARAKPLGAMPQHTGQFSADAQSEAHSKNSFELTRENFLALMFCLMVGTASLPHLLTRFYTTASVKETRRSVSWSLFFILLVYLTIPAVAIAVKYEIFTHLVGTAFDKLPAWLMQWSRVDGSLASVVDVNKDGVLQLAELNLSSDIIMLSIPEMVGLPYVITGLVAVGGLAAALSTADGLLITIASALSHDLYFKTIAPQATTIARVMVSKVLLLIVALLAAYVAAQKPGDIVFLVTAAFSLAAATLFPSLLLGIFWRRANSWGAIAAMLSGAGITMYYMVCNHPWLRGIWGIVTPVDLWWGIAPLAAGVFGVPLGLAVLVVVSLCTPLPSLKAQKVMDQMHA